MLESYFFIPGDKQKFIQKAKVLDADYFVFDLEESVSKNNKINAFNNLNALNIEENYYIRIPVFGNDYTKNQSIELINKFHGKIVIPKITDLSQIEWLINLSKWEFKFTLILLIEDPIGYYNIASILEHHNSHIKAIGFGTHDFCATMGMKHNEEQLNPYKKQLILLAKVNNIQYIDGVNTIISDSINFVKEAKYAFEAGANGKFIIHPNHLTALNNLELYSTDEINRMKFVYDKYISVGKNKMDIFTIDGTVYEKPHIMKIKKILDRLNHK